MMSYMSLISAVTYITMISHLLSIIFLLLAPDACIQLPTKHRCLKEMSNRICPKGEFIIYTIKIPPAVSFVCDGTARQFLSKVGGSPFMPFIPLSFLAQQPSCPSSLPLLFCSNPSYLVVQLFLTSLDVCNYSPHQFPLHAVAPTGLFRVRCRIQLLFSSSPYPVGQKTQSAMALETHQCTLIFLNTHYPLSDLNVLHWIIFLHHRV